MTDYKHIINRLNELTKMHLKAKWQKTLTNLDKEYVYVMQVIQALREWIAKAEQ
jgi:hypothetical protein